MVTRPTVRWWAGFAAASVLMTGCTAPLVGDPRLSPVDAATTDHDGARPGDGPTPFPGVTEPGTTSWPPPTAAPGPTDTGPTPTGTIGADGIGDPYYPRAGNGGYQVEDYDILLSYDPPTNYLDAVATITAEVTATEPLARFNLDLADTLTVTGVSIDGRPATTDHHADELIITPAVPLPAGGTVTITVRYAGAPGLIAGGTSSLGDGGWYRTDSGGAVVAGEPFSALAWFPANDHPADTATFAVTVMIPDGWQAVSVGTRDDDADLPVTPPGMHAVRYVQAQPVATYLTTIAIDELTFTTDEVDGIPILNAFTPAGADDRGLADRTGEVLTFLADLFGPYPFDSYGGIYTGEPIPFALETASRPIYADWVDLGTVIHETAHQWFGNDVTIATWADVCLNECFSSYAPWLWDERVEGADLDRRWREAMGDVTSAYDQSRWASPLVDMGVGHEFTAVYDRGPLAVHALRHALGDETFFALLPGWIDRFGGSNASFDDFETFVSETAGRDMTGFMDAWFRRSGPPPPPFLTPGTLTLPR